MENNTSLSLSLSLSLMSFILDFFSSSFNK